VERTRFRPLVSGVVTTGEAIGFLALQMMGGLCVLLSFNICTIKLALVTVPLIAVYPLMKRYINWPQAVLGLAFNYGALLGWTAVTAQPYWPVMVPLYLSGITWTLVYDTIYAHQDKKDDLVVGIKSTAILFGNKSKYYMACFSAMCCAGLFVTGLNNGMGMIYYVVSVGGGAAHFVWQLTTLNIDNPQICRRLFHSNKWFGALIFGGIVVDKILASPPLF